MSRAPRGPTGPVEATPGSTAPGEVETRPQKDSGRGSQQFNLDAWHAHEQGTEQAPSDVVPPRNRRQRRWAATARTTPTQGAEVTSAFIEFSKHEQAARFWGPREAASAGVTGHRLRMTRERFLGRGRGQGSPGCGAGVPGVPRRGSVGVYIGKRSLSYTLTNCAFCQGASVKLRHGADEEKKCEQQQCPGWRESCPERASNFSAPDAVKYSTPCIKSYFKIYSSSTRCPPSCSLSQALPLAQGLATRPRG